MDTNDYCRLAARAFNNTNYKITNRKADWTDGQNGFIYPFFLHVSVFLFYNMVA